MTRRYVGETDIPYQIRVGSARRTRLAIRVTVAGQVEVLLPPGESPRRAEEAVRLRADWIIRHVRRMRTLPQAAPLAWVSGEEHLWLGQPLRLDVLPSRSWQGVTVAEGRLVVSVRETASRHAATLAASNVPPSAGRVTAPSAVRRVIEAWYRAEAQRVIGERLHALAAHITWLPHVPVWQVKNLRRRWGSCNARGELLFNTRLVATPLPCIDYVILHELAHLRELNHSPAFYAELEALLPEWKARRKELNSFARRVLG